jgi:hypothetical protein
MEDNFEKYIKKHASEMDHLDLPEAAWDNIQKAKGQKPRSLLYLNAFRRIAAVLVLALAGYGLFNLASIKSKTVVQEEQVPAEILEMDQYYEAQISQNWQELNQKYPNNELVSQEVSVELEMLADEKERLIEELKQNFSNQTVLEELILVYRLRLEILEEVLSTLNEEKEKDYDQDNSFNT